MSATDNIKITAESKYVNPWRLFEGSHLPQWLMERPDIKPVAKLAYARLMRYAGQKGVAWPRLQTLATAIGVTESRAAEAIRELRHIGLIEAKKVRFGGGFVYRFLSHPWMLGAVEESSDPSILGFSEDRLDKEVENAYLSQGNQRSNPKKIEGMVGGANDTLANTCGGKSDSEESHEKRVIEEKDMGTLAKRLLDLAWKRCQEAGYPPFIVRGAAAIKALKTLIATYGRDDATWLVETFYRTPPEWHVTNGLLAPEHIPGIAQRLLTRRGKQHQQQEYRDVEVDGKMIRQFVDRGVVVRQVDR